MVWKQPSKTTCMLCETNLTFSCKNRCHWRNYASIANCSWRMYALVTYDLAIAKIAKRIQSEEQQPW